MRTEKQPAEKQRRGPQDDCHPPPSSIESRGDCIFSKIHFSSLFGRPGKGGPVVSGASVVEGEKGGGKGRGPRGADLGRQ